MTMFYDIKDQWMFGPALMACPVGEYQKYSRNVYLPGQKGWYDFHMVSTWRLWEQYVTGTKYNEVLRIARNKNPATSLTRMMIAI